MKMQFSLIQNGIWAIACAASCVAPALAVPPVKAPPAKASKPKKPKAKVEGQQEMLLPIAGGKAEAEAKPAKAPRRKAG